MSGHPKSALLNAFYSIDIFYLPAATPLCINIISLSYFIYSLTIDLICLRNF